MNTQHDTESLVAALKAADAALSRTVASSRVNNDVSNKKLPLLLAGTELAQAIEENRKLVAAYIIGAPKNSTASANDLHAAILTIASLTLRGMLPDSLFRKWSISGRKFGPSEDSEAVEPDQIASKLQVLADDMASSLKEDTISAAAALEWAIGTGPLHPFYDACGRISRASAALILVTSRLTLPAYPNRDDYFAASTQGRKQFERSFREWMTARNEITA